MWSRFLAFEERFHEPNSFKRQNRMVETDIGIAFMIMNLSKDFEQRWFLRQFSLFIIKIE